MAIKFKHPSIKYTSRDFNSIRNDLIEHAKRYYPDSFKDFNEASFGAMMVDSVAYVGDILSFYLDYQANESFLTTAHEYNNIIKHGKALGYKVAPAPSSYGVVTLFVRVPAAPSGFGPDTSFIPTLRRGTVFGSTAGAPYMLINDINFADPQNETVVAVVNETNGQPSEYAIRAYGEVVSGRLNVQTFKVGDFTKFRRIDLKDSNLTEILSVIDTAGREYFEVEYLSQNIIYRPVTNTGANSNSVPNLLKPFVAMRRFVVEREFGRNFLQFGYGSEDNLSNEGFLNPDDVALERHARNYITDRSFDPTKMLQSDKFGVSPSNTTLRVSYRTNDSTTVNAAVGTIIRVENSIFKFSNTNKLNNGLKNKVINSLEVTNDDPVLGGVTFPSTDEIKRRIFDVFTSQHRAVTAQDYKALIYMMPSKFGSIKRCNVLQDPDAMKRNLNISVVSEDANGNLAKTNDTIKNNLKNWLNQYRMVNDTIDILDARIVNIGIKFTIVSQAGTNRHTVLKKAENVLRKHFMSIGDISESVSISDIYRILNQISGVSDTADVTIVRKSGGAYSPIGFNIEEHMSFDGRYLIAPEDVIYEIRFLDTDIEGTVR
jgi:hypothetical protein